MTNAFRDAEELLTGPKEFWVSFTEEIANYDRDAFQKQSGLYHWRMDVYVFMAEERTMAICFGHPDEGEWFYTTDHDLIKPYLEALVHVSSLITEIQSQVNRDA